MLPRGLGVVMITVFDMARSVQFYRDVLGLPLRFESPHWTEFDTETVTLALHSGGPPPTAPSSEGPPVAGSVSTGWYVKDLDVTCEALKERGVRFVREPTTLEGEGIRLAVFLDPDGCALSLAQRINQ